MNILITGAAKRVGGACVSRLHADGHNIFLHYRQSKSEAEALAMELNRLRSNSVITAQADLLNLSEVTSLAKRAEMAWDGIDVLINNASAFYATEMGSVTEQQWDELFGSNLKSAFFLTQSLSTELAARKGCVVNIVDIHAERGLKDYPVYSMAKAGLAAMTRILARELGPDVRVNGVAPGAIIWPEINMSEQQKQEVTQRIALRRSGCPEDIVNAVRYLIYDAGYVTGQIISVDGGRTLFC